MAVQRNMDAGMSASEALRAARRRFGGRIQPEQESREAWAFRLIGELARDVRYTMRGLGRSPGFAVAAVLTVALGVGANTAMFSVLYGTCLAPLPYADPSRLVDVSMMQATGHKFEAGTSPSNLRDWIAGASSFDGLAAHRPQFVAGLSGGGDAEEVHAWRISARALALLGTPPALGRWFTPEEDFASGPRSALLSYQLWQDRFGGDSTIPGKTVTVDGEPFTIAGVMPDRFEFPPLVGGSTPVLWLSLNLPAAMLGQRDTRSLHVIGRLKPGVTITRAQAEMSAIAGRLAKAYPKENGEWPEAKVSPLGEDGYVNSFRATLWLLSGASGLVLLIACANVAGLLVARGAARAREFTIRRALGVSAGRLMRQVLTESCCLAGIGCAAGVVAAFWSMPVLKSMLEGSPRAGEIGIRPPVLVFAAGISLLTGILFGIAPALLAGRGEPGGPSASRGGPPRQRTREILVAAEIALGLVLLSGAGLLMESFWRATRVDLGFHPDHVLSMRFDLPARRYDTGRRVDAFREELLRSVSALPGVEFAGLNSAPPMGVLSQHTDYEMEGAAAVGRQNQSASFANVSPDYLRAMGIPVLRGRNFAPADGRGSTRVAVVSQAVARASAAGQEILGRRIWLGRDIAEWFTVIGVAGDVRENGPDRPPEGAIYALNSQLPPAEQGNAAARTIVLVARTAGDPGGLVNAIRAAAARIDKDQPIADLLTMRQLVDKHLATRRWNAILIGLFAFLAVVLAIVGVFGLVSYSVSTRTNEIGIRMALGAGRSTILAMIVRDTLAFGAVGILAGLAGAVGSSHLLASMLYGVAPRAPHILFASAAFLGAATIWAAIIAGRRAIVLDPVGALRHE